MSWVADYHYGLIIQEERLARARTSGKGLNLRFLREAWSVLRERVAGPWERRIAGDARPSAANVRPLEVQ